MVIYKHIVRLAVLLMLTLSPSYPTPPELEGDLNGDGYRTIDDILWYFYLYECGENMECEHQYALRLNLFELNGDNRIDSLDAESYIRLIAPVGISSNTTSYYYLEWHNTVQDSIPHFSTQVMSRVNYTLEYISSNNPACESYIKLFRATIGNGGSTGHYALSADYHNNDKYPAGIINLYDLREYFNLFYTHISGQGLSDSLVSMMDYNFDGVLDIRDIEPAVHYHAVHADNSTFFLRKWDTEDARLFAKRWCGYYRAVNSEWFQSICDRFGFERDTTDTGPLPGDMNNDNALDINDVIIFFNCLSGDLSGSCDATQTMEQADLNYDGEATTEDTDLFLYLILHKAFEHFPRFFPEPRAQQKEDLFSPAITERLNQKAKEIAETEIAGIISVDQGWAGDLEFLADRLNEIRSEQSGDFDFNRDGLFNIADAIALIIYQRKNPDSLMGDINEDGQYDVNDVIELILFIRNMKSS